MITTILILAHALKAKDGFDPIPALYLGTLIADVMIFQAIFGGLS